MATAEEEASAVAKNAKADGEDDWAVFQAEYERRLAERQEKLMRDASASARAMDGWALVKTPVDWQENFFFGS